MSSPVRKNHSRSSSGHELDPFSAAHIYYGDSHKPKSRVRTFSAVSWPPTLRDAERHGLVTQRRLDLECARAECAAEHGEAATEEI